MPVQGEVGKSVKHATSLRRGTAVSIAFTVPNTGVLCRPVLIEPRIAHMTFYQLSLRRWRLWNRIPTLECWLCHENLCPGLSWVLPRARWLEIFWDLGVLPSPVHIAGSPTVLRRSPQGLWRRQSHRRHKQWRARAASVVQFYTGQAIFECAYKGVNTQGEKGHTKGQPCLTPLRISMLPTKYPFICTDAVACSYKACMCSTNHGSIP